MNEPEIILSYDRPNEYGSFPQHFGPSWPEVKTKRKGGAQALPFLLSPG